MTLKECQLAAYWRIPVLSDGVPYRRISQVAINFRDPEKVRDEKELEPWYDIVLESVSGNSITHASPRQVTPREPETFAEREAQYNQGKEGRSPGGG